MNLNEYIKTHLKLINPGIVKSLGGSEKLIEYVRYTPWNTNSEVAKAIAGNESSTSAVVGEAVVGTAVI